MTILIPAWTNGTLSPVEKLKVHQDGLRHKAVSIFVIAQGKLLLQQRAYEKYHTPGLWTNTCCTHPHWEEDPATCAKRRLVEELNLETDYLTHRGTIEYRADVGGGLFEHEVVDLFTVSFDAPFEVTPNPHEVYDTKWAALETLQQEVDTHPSHYTPWFRIYVHEHLNAILGTFVSAKTA